MSKRAMVWAVLYAAVMAAIAELERMRRELELAALYKRVESLELSHRAEVIDTTATDEPPLADDELERELADLDARRPD
jgi:hypothetical protein